MEMELDVFEKGQCCQWVWRKFLKTGRISLRSQFATSNIYPFFLEILYPISVLGFGFSIF